MILYTNKKTYSVYKLDEFKKLPREIRGIDSKIRKKEENEPLFQWGFQLFYYENRKCIHMIHYASCFHLILLDVKEMKNIGNLMFSYMLSMYEQDEEMTNTFKKMFDENHIFVFDIIKKDSIQSLLRNDEIEILDCIDSYIKEGVLDTLQLNFDFNFKRETNYKEKGKIISINPSQSFREQVINRYSSEEQS